MSDLFADLSDTVLVHLAREGRAGAMETLIHRHEGHPPVAGDARPAAFAWADFLSGAVPLPLEHEEARS